MALLILVLLALAEKISALSVENACEDYREVVVETMVFSGTPNPVFDLNGAEWEALCGIIRQNTGNFTLPTCRVLGFTGFKLCPVEKEEDCVILRGNPAVDAYLFEAFSGKFPDTPFQVMDHIAQELDRLHKSDGGDARCAHEEFANIYVNTTSCKREIIGPDDPTEVHYDPSHDDNGCFVTRQRDNNCYNYGNDIVTNTFAQPGRGSGVCPPNTRPCVKNTCDDVMNAAISDGLKWVGTKLPDSLPTTGHYVSLHIWPETNFHWIRMDANRYWSHKPGGSPVRNVDNNHRKITDPSKSDFAPWTQHCGYLLAVPSQGTIDVMSADHMVIV